MGWQDESDPAVPTLPAKTPTAPLPQWMQDQSDPVGALPSGLPGYPAPPVREAQTMGDYIQAAFQNTSTGILVRGKMPDVTIGADAPWYDRAVAGAAGVAADLPMMAVGYLGGGAVGGAVGGGIGSAAPGLGTVAGAAAGNAIGGGAGAMAIPAMARQALIQAYTNGSIKDGTDFAHRVGAVLWDGFKAGSVGAVGGVAGLGVKATLFSAAGVDAATATKMAAASAAPDFVVAATKAGIPAADIAIGQQVLSKTTTTAADLAGQTAAMTVTGAALEGRVPEWHEFLDSAILLGGIHASGVVAGRLVDIYKATGKRPGDVLADAAQDPALKEELVGPMPRPMQKERDLLTADQQKLFIDAGIPADQQGHISTEAPPEMTSDGILAAAKTRIAELEAKTDLTPTEAAEKTILGKVQDDPAALATTYGVKLKDQEPIVSQYQEKNIEENQVNTTENANIGGENQPKSAVGEAPKAPDFTDVKQPVGDVREEHPDVQAMLKTMATDEAGWAEVGGKLIRTPTGDRVGEEIISRTKWIPKAEWWPGRPGGLSEVKTKAAVEKALKGEKLNAAEKRAVEYMTKIARERMLSVRGLGEETWTQIADDIKAEGVEPTTKDVDRVDLVDKANQIDPEAVKRATMAHADDDAAFFAEMQRIVDEKAQAGGLPENSQASGPEAPESVPAADAGTSPQGAAQPGPGTGAASPLRFAEHPVYRQVKDELDKLGRFTEQQRDHAARIIQAYYDAMVDYTGKTLDEVMKIIPPVRFAEDPELGGLEQPAFHGSPHDFDKFSIDKIGTGEGKGAFGHGLYFAENEGIAKGYRERLSNTRVVDKAGNLLHELKNGEKLTPKNMAAHVLGNEKAEAELRKSNGPIAKEAVKVLDQWKAEGAKPEAAGHLYQIDVPDEHVAKMLDWDKPISEQREIATPILKKLGYLADDDNDPAHFATAVRSFKNERHADTGQALYRALSKELAREKGEGGTWRAGNDKEASDYLNSTGVPGIKYLDATSRAAGEGSRNLVVFDDGIVKLTHKDGSAVSAAEKTKLLQRQEGKTDAEMARGNYSSKSNVIGLGERSDPSTLIHEPAHFFLESTMKLSRETDSPELKEDMATLLRWFGIDEAHWDKISADQSEEWVKYHEKWASGFERYVAEGKAPTSALRKVFERFADWMREVYTKLTAAGQKVPPEIEKVMGKLLGGGDVPKAEEIPSQYKPIADAERAREIIPGDKAEEIAAKPFADEIVNGPGEAPDTTRVNVQYINGTDDLKLAMLRMAEVDQENIQKQRGGPGGVKSWAYQAEEAAKYLNGILGGSADTLKILIGRNPDDPGVSMRLRIMKDLTVKAAEFSANKRDELLTAGVNATVRQKLEYLGSIERSRMIQAEFLGERADVARALNALKDTASDSQNMSKLLETIGTGEPAEQKLFQSPEEKAQADEDAALKKKLDEIVLNQFGGKDPLEIAKLHKDIDTLSGHQAFAKEVTQATTWEKVVEAWKSGLVSGPITHVTNLFGTGIFAAMAAPVDAVAAGIGLLRGAKVGGEGGRMSLFEPIARAVGLMQGTMDGLKVAAAAIMHGADASKAEQFRPAIGGLKGEIIRLPYRLLGAEDALVSTMVKRGEASTLAMRQAISEGLSPNTQEYTARVNDLVQHPNEAMANAVEAAGERFTFNSPLSERGHAVQSFVKAWHLEWAVPFIRTPINVATELLRMSPFAPIATKWREDIMAGGIRRDRAIAEMTVGSGIYAVTMAYAFGGNISGAGSPDAGKQRGKAGVWQPYSVKIGNTWYNYSRIQPMGTLMGMAADTAEIWDHLTADEADKIPKMLSVAFANAITNQTFLQGIATVVNALGDPTRFGPKFVQGMAGSVVPNIIAQPTSMLDPVQREVNTILDAVKARIPGYRQELLPKRDYLGEPMQTKERLGAISPVQEQKISDDKVRQEVARLDISVPTAPKKTHIGAGTGKIGDIDLTPEEKDVFATEGGKMAKDILTQMVNDPSWDSAPDIIQRKMIQRVFVESHKYAAFKALPLEKRQAALDTITEKMTQELDGQ